jgi:MinD superfamily P-loop ATPase
MRELVIISGKGGTGKTSIVGSLAALGKSKVVVDCDVDAADLHLLLNNNITEIHDFIVSCKASINRQRCSDCGLCADYCRFDAIKYEQGEYRIDQFACEGCGVCRYFCPEYAIAYEPVKSGEWFISHTDHGPLVHARLGIAESNSGRLVSLLRQKAREIADKNEYDLVLIDGPPGIGCPVIASITGASYVLIVTEPSQSAFHDLNRLLELIEHFKINCGVVINKSDINLTLTDHIKKDVQARGIRVVAEIPFDPMMTEAQINSQTLIEYTVNDSTRKIEQIWKTIYNEMQSSPGFQQNSKKEIL